MKEICILPLFASFLSAWLMFLTKYGKVMKNDLRESSSSSSPYIFSGDYLISAGFGSFRLLWKTWPDAAVKIDSRVSSLHPKENWSVSPNIKSGLKILANTFASVCKKLRAFAASVWVGVVDCIIFSAQPPKRFCPFYRKFIVMNYIGNVKRRCKG